MPRSYGIIQDAPVKKPYRRVFFAHEQVVHNQTVPPEDMPVMTLRKNNAAAAITERRQAMRFNPAKGPERLVGIGFRCWLAGYRTDDINCWETGWNMYARELGPACAKAAITELSCWVRAVHQQSCRLINYYPFECSGFCADECVAISMVAACQHSKCPAMRSCAFALLGSSEIDGVVESATDFANVLSGFGHILSDTSICHSSVLAGLDMPVSSAGKH